MPNERGDVGDYCRKCGGSGIFNSRVCRLCKGDGKVRRFPCLRCEKSMVMRHEFDKICLNCSSRKDDYMREYRVILG